MRQFFASAVFFFAVTSAVLLGVPLSGAKNGADALSLHARTGALIAESRSLSLKEQFAWTIGDVAWTPDQWLADVLLSFTVSAMDGIEPGSRVLLVGLLLVIAAYASCLVIGDSSVCCSRKAIIFGFFLYLLAGWSLLEQGRQVWSLALFPLLFVELVQLKRLSWLRVLLLCALWRNLEPTCVVLPVFCLSITVGAFFDAERTRFRNLVIVSLASVAALFLHPSSAFPPLMLFDRRLLASPILREIFAFRTADFHLHQGVLLVFFAALFCLALSPVKIGWQFVLGWICSLVIMFFSSQFSLAFCFMSAVIAGMSISVFSQAMESGRRGGMLNWAMAAVVLSCFFLVLACVKKTSRETSSAALGFAIRQYAENEGFDAAGLRLFNEYEMAGDLIDQSIKVFLDSRRSLFLRPQLSATGRGIIGDYAELMELSENYGRVLSYWNFDAAVLTAGSPLANILVEREGWIIVRRMVYGSPKRGLRTGQRAVLLLAPGRKLS